MEGAMCGRFTLFEPDAILSKEFGAPIRFDLKPRYNVSPSQPILAARVSPKNGREGHLPPVREFTLLRWGLIPSWAKDASIGNRMINARAETVAEKPSFRDAFRHRRCLVPMSGFFEWSKRGVLKQPHFIALSDKRVMAVAGLWERWEGRSTGEGQEGSPIESCTLLTTEANELIAPMHDRMPVIVAPGNYDLWLNASGQDLAALQPLLTPYPPGEMFTRPVSLRVNNPSADDERLLDLPSE
jgi:putative SOS response-associated peptidase YedK